MIEINKVYNEDCLETLKKIPNNIFNSFIKEIIKLDFEKIDNSENFNISDGTTYELNVFGEAYTLSLSPNSSNVATKERGLQDFYNLCIKIWSYTEK